MAQVKKRPWERCQWFGLGYKWRRIRSTDRRDVGTRETEGEDDRERHGERKVGSKISGPDLNCCSR